MFTIQHWRGSFFFIFFWWFPRSNLLCHQLSFSHPDNALEVCGLLTPLHIVPEWYFLCQYAMLKAVPNKNAGFIILLTSIFTFFFFGEIRNLTTLCLLNNNGFLGFTLFPTFLSRFLYNFLFLFHFLEMILTAIFSHELCVNIRIVLQFLETLCSKHSCSNSSCGLIFLSLESSFGPQGNDGRFRSQPPGTRKDWCGCPRKGMCLTELFLRLDLSFIGIFFRAAREWW
jgi:hypothetical protein